MSKIFYPLPKPPSYTESKESRGFEITLRPHDDNRFTNEAEERKKIIDYAKNLKNELGLLMTGNLASDACGHQTKARF